MEYDAAFALHITWTCYGTWLPGDRRGYVSNTVNPVVGYEPKRNMPGTPYTADNAYTHRRARSLQKGATVLLSSAQALCAANCLVEAAKVRQWRILRGALMANHVHVVVTDCPDNGEAVRRILKGNTQAALSRAAGENRRWWTAGGSDRYKHGTAAIEAAIRYVADQPGVLAEIINMEAMPAKHLQAQ